MTRLSESTLIEAFDGGRIYLTKGAKSFIEESLRNAPSHVREEALEAMPFLMNIQRSAEKSERKMSYSNAELAVALRAFMDDCSGGLSRSLFHLIDAWAIAIAGMSKVRPSTRNDVDPSDIVGATPAQYD